jgi:hypothetical protein
LTGVGERDVAAPGRFALSQNYPNPFNPSTTVVVTVPQRERVTVTVHDLLGREVATVADREFDAGSHNVAVGASGLSSGVYFCRVNAGGKMQTITMMLAR